MAHVLLIQPNSGYTRIGFSLTLASLGGSLKKAGHEVSYILLDLPWNVNWAPTEVFSGIDVVGITVSSCDFDKSIEIQKKIKLADPEITVIAGGAHATFAPESLLNNGFDICVRGEGEYTIVDVVKLLKNHESTDNKLGQIKGISYHNSSDKIIHNSDREFIQDLDSLPLLDWYQDDYQRILKEFKMLEHVAELDVLPDPKTISLLIESSRGCPYQCVFCTTSKIKGKQWRSKSSQRILAEFHHFKNFYHTVFKKKTTSPSILIQFPDDNFCLDTKRVLSFCREIVKIPQQEQPKWTVMSRANKIKNVSLLRTMRESGCIRIFMGAECGYSDGLKKIKKGITLEMIHQAVESAIEANLPILIISWIIGFPWETRKNSLQTILTALKIAFRAQGLIRTSIYTFTPIIGADITESMGIHNRGQISDHVRYKSWGFCHPNMKDQDLFELQMLSKWLIILIQFQFLQKKINSRQFLIYAINDIKKLTLNIKSKIINKIFLQMNKMFSAHFNHQPAVILQEVNKKIPQWITLIEEELKVSN